MELGRDSVAVVVVAVVAVWPNVLSIVTGSGLDDKSLYAFQSAVGGKSSRGIRRVSPCAGFFVNRPNGRDA